LEREVIISAFKKVEFLNDSILYVILKEVVDVATSRIETEDNSDDTKCGFYEFPSDHRRPLGRYSSLADSGQGVNFFIYIIYANSTAGPVLSVFGCTEIEAAIGRLQKYYESPRTD
jgi:hypothetical protein